MGDAKYFIELQTGVDELYSDTLESELNPFQNPVRVPRQFFPFKIIETGLIHSWVPRTRIFKMILTVNTQDFKVKINK
jgi:hypothetical protein